MSAQGVGAARYIGARVPRKEDGRLLTGRGQFVDDISLPGMLHVAFARSPVARGRIVSINTDAARDVAGVHAIYTAADYADSKVEMLSFFLLPQTIKTTPLADGRVAYVGDPVALVIASDRATAEDAASLIEIQYEEEAPVVTIGDAKTKGAIHPDADSNVAVQMGDDDLDEEFEAKLADSALLLTHDVKHARVSQSPMETRGIVVTRDGAEELTVYITCQSPHAVARWISQALGVPQGAIRVIAKDVGGSFGLKNHPWKEETAVIIAAMRFGRPLKWIEDRLENLTSANQAREQEMTLRIAFDKNGTLLASHGAYDVNNGAYPQGADCNVAVHMFLWAAYKLPAYAFVSRGLYTNTVGLAAYRGPWAMETLARETALDVAARKLGVDPIEIRKRNLIKKADLPVTTAMGIPVDDISPAECLDILLKTLDVAAFRAEQTAARKQGRYLGLGVATYIEPTGAAGGFPVLTGELAQIRIEPTGKVTALMSTHSQGHGTATTMAQVIADKLGVDYEDVTVFEGDSSRGGYSPGAAGSRQGVIGGGAAIKASELLLQKIKILAAHQLNASPESVRVEGGMVMVDGAPEMTRSLRAIAETAYGEPAKWPEGFESGLEVQHRYMPPPMTFTSAAHACIVEVDIETGFVKILRWLSSEDCGTIINPAVVEGQIAGGLAQAIGTVLLEEAVYDARGNPTTVTYKDYLLPSISDVPVFEYLHASTPSQSVGGIRGVGEGGAIIGPPTLVNAIADALSSFGEIEVDLPLTPVKILSLIEGRDLSAHKKVEAVSSVDAIAVPTSVVAAAPTEVRADGDWKLVMSTPMGPQEMVAHFETDGSALSGELRSPEGSQAFTGTITGNQLKFELKVEKPMKITLNYELAIDGDALSGKCKMGMMGSAKIKGERVGGSVPVARQEAMPASVAAQEVAASAATSPADVRIDGDWKMVMSSPMGPQEMTAHFETNGAALSGELRSPEGSQAFTGTVTGNQLKFELKVEKPMKITLNYDLAVDGDALSGKCKMGMMGSAKIKGERL